MKSPRRLIFLCTFILMLGMAFVPGALYAQVTPITFTGEELLGKPTNNSITVNIVPDVTIEYHYQYGTSLGGPYTDTSNFTATGGQPHEVDISGLDPNTQYYYRMQYHIPGDGEPVENWVLRDEHSFWTQRAPGSTFTFTIVSDSHAMYNPQYQQAMTNVNDDHPDFHFDLGDTFMTDSDTSQNQVDTEYLAQRDPLYMGKIGPSVPIFLASGNHENEEGWNIDDTPFSIALGSVQARKAYYPTPIPGGSFYSGNTDPLAAIDEATYGDEFREDYYAWTWGDALFVVIDPFQYTMENPYGASAGEGSDDQASGDRWNWTLGQEQFNWFKQTIENSSAKFKFVFAHHMLGGTQNYVRGGAVPAHMFEWGGENLDGSWGFTDHRNPELFGTTPIRDLMIDNGVSAFFHGHDHQYAYEVRDGIVYQSMPRPSTGLDFNYYSVGEYTLSVLPSPGYLRVTVNPDITTVEYVDSSNASAITKDNYTILPGPELTMAVDPPGGGTTDPSGVHTYGLDVPVAITATPAAGYVFDHWDGDVTDPYSELTTVMMDADKTVTAYFTNIFGLDGLVSSDTADDVSTIAIPHTTGTGTDRLMLVGVSWNSLNTAVTISSVTFGSSATALTEVITEKRDGKERRSAIYSLLNPPSGVLGDVTVTFSGSVTNGIVAGVANFAGVDQTTPLGSSNGANGSSTAPSVELTGLTGDELVFSNIFQGAANVDQTLTFGDDQTELWNAWIANTRAAASIEEADGSSVTMSGTAASSSDWVNVAVAINPAGGDTTNPTVTIEQASGQDDPTVVSPVNFTVVFSEPVADFATGDVTLGGTAGATTDTVTEIAPNNGTTYNVAVSGMTGSGTVIASIAAGVAHDGATNPNDVSTSSDNEVTYIFDITGPTVTIDQASGQSDPTGASPINFTVVFSEPVSDFATGDVTLGGTAGATTDTVTEIAPNDGTTYNVDVSGMTDSGTVTASIAAGVAHDVATNPNDASTSSDNIVDYEYTAPVVSYIGDIGSITANDAGITLQIPVGSSGVAAGNTIIVGFASRGNPTYNEPVVTDSAGNIYNLATFAVTYQHGRSYLFYAYVDTALEDGDNITITTSSVASRVAVASVFSGLLDVNVLDQALENPTGTSTTEQGNNPTVGPTGTTAQANELIISVIGTEEATDAGIGTWGNDFETGPQVKTSGATYEWRVSMGYKMVAATGEYTASKTYNNNPYWAATIATFKAVEEDITNPTVTINKASGQDDPTVVSPVNFTVVFSEPVADFATGDVTLGGTAGATTDTVTEIAPNNGTTYNVAVSGMTGSGTVIASIAAGVAHDGATNPNEASTSSDNEVTYNIDITYPTVTIDQASGQADPTGASPINFTVVFSEPVADFATGDVTLGGTAPGAITADVTEIAPNDGTTYNVAVSGMTDSGTVTASIAAGVAHDGAGNPNDASTSSDDTVAYEYTPSPLGLDGASSSGTDDDVSTIDVAHTTGTGTDRLMLVGVSWNCGTTNQTISSVVFDDGTAYPLTAVRTEQTGTQLRYSAIYSLLNPPSGQTGTVTVTFSGTIDNGIVVGVANFAGVDQTTPLGTPYGANANSTAPSVTLTELNGNELVFDNVFQGASGETQTLTAGADQTEQWTGWIANVRASASTEQATGDSVTMSWTAASSSYWAIAAVPINPAVISGEGILGDVNGDTVVNSTDALIVLSCDAGLDTSDFCPMNCGDVNADGLINSTDALIILSYDAGMSVSFPVGQPGACPSVVTPCAGCNP